MARSHATRVTLASLIGGSIEYYEFFIYGLSASLVFSKLFFPSFDSFVGTLLSLSTFGLAFLARPLGGWLAGHFGDRIGRKTVMMATLIGMGGATTLVGLLPTYGTVGVAAPILLIVLRIVQGISVAGETTGGFLLTFEHTRGGKRPGLLTGLVSTGNVCGLLLANGVFLLAHMLPDDQFMSWGWRLPFLFSAVLVGVGLYVRSRLEESPDFETVREDGAVAARPAIEVIRRHPGAFLGLILMTVPQSIYFYMASVFAFTYAETVEVSTGLVNVMVMITSALLILVMPFFGSVADRTGRPKTIFAIGMAMMVIAPFVWFPLFDTGNAALIFPAFLLLLGGFGISYGTQGVLFPSLLPPHLRYSGIGIGVALGGVFGGAFAPLIALALFDHFDSWLPVALYMSGTAVLGLVATLLMRVRGADTAAPKTSPVLAEEAA
ncbi:MFS transporter [Streptomyces arenae]|uniref:MFS transporter n=1 Tax=Streptomyces arenae TaxID=29301 RepID=UPI002659881D|nr:MFS transporter [Streptomyces arenae]MCG7205127.1 MHS family MFS transporter [Streptomyces arenae]